MGLAALDCQMVTGIDLDPAQSADTPAIPTKPACCKDSKMRRGIDWLQIRLRTLVRLRSDMGKDPPDEPSGERPTCTREEADAAPDTDLVEVDGGGHVRFSLLRELRRRQAASCAQGTRGLSPSSSSSLGHAPSREADSIVRFHRRDAVLPVRVLMKRRIGPILREIAPTTGGNASGQVPCSLIFRTEATAELGSQRRFQCCARGNAFAWPLTEQARSSAADRSLRTSPSARRSAIRRSHRALNAPS
jgi:hypothetical protein